MPKSERSMVPDATPMSYYGQPILKDVVWEWQIAGYLFTGGLAAGSALAGAGVRLGGDRRLAGAASWLSMGAIAVSGGFLVYDLGRPERFYNMLRVFKPTSPMSVGTWIFSAFSAVSGAGLAAEVGKWLGVVSDPLAARASRAGQLGAALVAPALGTYTAVLIADTSVPAWKEGHRHLPALFAGSATAAGAGAVAALGAAIGSPASSVSAAARLAVVGATAEVVADEAMHRHLRGIATGDAAHPDLSSPYHEPQPRRLHLAARALTVLGALLSAVPAVGGRSRRAAIAGGLSLAGGSLLTRFAIFEAGRVSAHDPVYTAGPQRRRLAARAAAERSNDTAA